MLLHQIFDQFTKVLDDRSNLIASLQTSELNLGDLLILLKMFKKTALTLNEVPKINADTLVAQLQEMVSFFDLNTGKSMKLLWNFFRPMTLSTKSVFDVERSIQEIATSISYFTTDKHGTFSE
jgi:hypothetical protein